MTLVYGLALFVSLALSPTALQERAEPETAEPPVEPTVTVVDSRLGKGRAAKVGDVVTVRWALVDKSTNFPQSWAETGLAYRFKIREKDTHPWRGLVAGMQVGGTRRIEIPEPLIPTDPMVKRMALPGRPLRVTISLLKIDK